jgi:flagellar motor switch protein FliM
MNKKKPPQKLIPASATAALPVYALTRQQRHVAAASQLLQNRLADYSKALQLELGRMLTDVDFSVDVSLCSGVGLDAWLAQTDTLLLDVDLLQAQQLHCLMAADHQAVHQMADLFLGGHLTDSSQYREKTELSSSELRISCRLLQKQAQVWLQLLFNQHLPLTAHVCKQALTLDLYRYVPLKVRFILDKVVVSWYLWLPVGLFQTEASDRVSPAAEPALLLQDWQPLPVRAQVEMARKQVTVQQLELWLQGQLLPLELLAQMPLRLGPQLLCYGNIAEEGHKLMFQISKLAENT